MKVVLTSMISGAVGATMVAMFWHPLFAASLELTPGAGDFRGNCQVKVVSPRPTSSQRCFQDEVMTGRWDDMIYCATIQVACEP